MIRMTRRRQRHSSLDAPRRKARSSLRGHWVNNDISEGTANVDRLKQAEGKEAIFGKVGRGDDGELRRVIVAAGDLEAQAGSGLDRGDAGGSVYRAAFSADGGVEEKQGVRAGIEDKAANAGGERNTAVD